MVRINIIINNKAVKAQIKNLPCIIKKKKEENINENKVNINNTTKKKISSTGPISFSLSFIIKNFAKELTSIICLI
jgi:hypothetical protein